VSRLLIDTSAYSAWVRGYARVREPIEQADALYVSVVVIGELLGGFLGGSRQKQNETWLRDFLSAPRVEVLPIDEGTTPPYAAIYSELRRRGTPVSPNDLWIAASAYQHGLRVLTLDGDFRQIPHVLVDHVEPPQPAT